jgi:lysophospholipase
VTTPALHQFLTRANITDFDVSMYLDQISHNADNLPIIAIAISGGGYRALMNGAGALAAFDNRTPNSTSQGHLGGLLQATTYISGLSGGSWLIGSLYMQNFPPVQDVLVGPSGLWQFDNSILKGNPLCQSPVTRMHIYL